MKYKNLEGTELEGIPEVIIDRMLECQVEQGNKADIDVFKKNRRAYINNGGFNWNDTHEDVYIWSDVLLEKNFDSFYKFHNLWQQTDKEPQSPFNQQVGGNHYKDYQIQPIEFIIANNIGFIEGNVIKYVCRHKDKNGKEDILKAIHYLRLLLNSQYPENTSKKQAKKIMQLKIIYNNLIINKNNFKKYLLLSKKSYTFAIDN